MYAIYIYIYAPKLMSIITQVVGNLSTKYNEIGKGYSQWLTFKFSFNHVQNQCVTMEMAGRSFFFLWGMIKLYLLDSSPFPTHVHLMLAGKLSMHCMNFAAKHLHG